MGYYDELYLYYLLRSYYTQRCEPIEKQITNADRINNVRLDRLS
jgi:hypothetical protein